jgi:hypothetical protein
VPPEVSDFLSGFGLPTDLLLDLPVGEQILMAASRTLPGTFDGIGTTLVKHLHDEVAMETHGRVTQDHFSLSRLSCNCHIIPPVEVRALLPRLSRTSIFANY